MIYLDTSAFLKLYIREEGSEAVNTVVSSQDEPLPVWDLLEAEMMNALRLKVFWGDIADEQADMLSALFDQRIRRGQYFCPMIDRPELMQTFRDLGRETPRIGCRTMDIMHVAAALQLGTEGFLTFDERQRRLALHAGLRVLPESPQALRVTSR